MMDESLKDPKRLLEDSATDPRPSKRHSPSSVASPPSPSPYATSYTSAAPRSTNMGPLGEVFDYFTNEADADSDNEQVNSYDPYDYYNNYSMSSSPTTRGGFPNFDPTDDNADSQVPPLFPGTHAQDTLDIYMNGSDDEDAPTDDSPPEGVAATLEATAVSTGERSTSPTEQPSATADSRSSASGHTSRKPSSDSSDSSDGEVIDLREYDEAARDHLYQRAFGPITVPFEEFKIPDFCDDYPEYTDEILAAYVKYTTFTVKVWANYDSWIKKLYRQDTRVQTCGKLQLPAKSRKELKDLQFSNIQLLIGNPFRTLFKVDLHAESGQLQVTGKECHRDVHAPHDNLRWVVREAINIIERDGIIASRTALTLEDLDEIAKEFVVLPKTQSDAWKYFMN